MNATACSKSTRTVMQVARPVGISPVAARPSAPLSARAALGRTAVLRPSARAQAPIKLARVVRVAAEEKVSTTGACTFVLE